MISCSIIGATSYTGNELIRLLAKHPNVKFGCLTTRSEDPVLAAEMVPSLGKNDTLWIEKFDEKKVLKVSDVIFLTLPHTAAMEYGAKFFKAGKVVIDLSADFRFQEPKVYEEWYRVKHSATALLKKAVYGLPEIYREQIKKANLIANPGCYPTGPSIALYPLLKGSLIQAESIVIDAKSGVSGAGKKLSQVTQYCEVDENFSAYKVNCHQHQPEIEQTLSAIAGKKIKITFVPHLLPLQRGILCTIYLKRKRNASKQKIVETFEKFAGKQPFVRFLGHGKFPGLHQVQYTNFCDIGIAVDENSDGVIVITAIDNLLKGASSQAIQNMNIRMGFAETAGLL
ncbi:MAG: N-acetyl-gamma-glutamyl-phosphate reductase [Omnitrophica bacterium RIFCSPLOWO2_12_FULL_44_17]|uniref:N-acetyl-gamma-glutamyl-phosphate reductase n=1 Tax=Candidatus Danuiimicrobium aquiferis TaxID=1801832 RepID=A0A1G1L1L7_9BACT|nr:MAG: N-acetyl-gamma-glutamyl-phosphate reductase [Omnitrophica bacterium RIFCSPHIGHO2_02_FULL_45_28]OGW88924.1 MAG: N-acetyl-gamma-glutamyl-phosphate reductase [Omnitrophica bacterium RIFCSPHIGHO2_12_FULL_44_12]OGW99031.1 MAG: N-acetyl-gamma-glutamyl-phosphate reductase [Omnitrophica bacterium RIFCSPLOWO2_12_FULL_44_17]OGX02572.1 MAG: N-acetyl-gamma-glutamyl-phosphate reductase [Omnitrophica bacterium RIFCSPLOWO2_02_FULL_44_11]